MATSGAGQLLDGETEAQAAPPPRGTLGAQAGADEERDGCCPQEKSPLTPAHGRPHLVGGARPRPLNGHRLGFQLRTQPREAPASQNRKQL